MEYYAREESFFSFFLCPYTHPYRLSVEAISQQVSDPFTYASSLRTSLQITIFVLNDNQVQRNTL